MSCFADFAIELKDLCRTKKAKTAISMDPAAEARRLALAEQKIQLGEVSHGRLVLEAAAVAPRTTDTLNQLV